METFQQPKITGYRQLSEQEVALMNEAKALAEQVGEFVKRLREHPPAALVDPAAAMPNGKVPIDQRWVHIGATQLQQGFMALTRAIAQPTTF